MEKSVEKYLKDKVEAIGGLCLKFNTLSLNGMPDRLVLMPNGVAVFVELKDKGKKPRADQELRLEMLKSMGFRAEWFDRKEQIDVFINSIV